MRKKMIALFLIVLMSSSLFSMSSLSAESIHVRKVLSVVYDDSGSMATDGSMNWSYANYAMQTLCGLLNPDDELFITYMSNPGEAVVPTGFSTDRQAAVDNIRTTLNSGDTPQSAITTASNKLLESYQANRESSPNTEYWLVVISDGEFNEEGVFGKAELDSSLQNFSQTQMSDGMDLNTIYLAIGSNAIEAASDSYLNITAKRCDDGAAIVTVLSELSNSISGRYRLNSADIVLVNDNTIEFTSEISLINISILIQNSSATLESIVKEDGTTLRIDQQVSLTYPEMSERTTDTSLNGQALLIGNSGQNISSGTYTLVFSDKIDSNALDIMLEPAFELRMAVLKNGKEVTDLASLHENDVIDIEMQLFESGTNTQVDTALLEEAVTYSIGYMEENTVIHSGSSLTLSGITLKALKTEIYGSLTFAEFMPLNVSLKVTPSFTVAEETSSPSETSEYVEPSIPVESEAPPPPDPSDGIVYGIIIDVPQGYDIDRDDLSDIAAAMRFIITRKGIPQSKEEIENIPFEVSINKNIPYSLLLEEDGSYSFRPLSKWPLFFYPTGIISVKATVNNSVTSVGYIEIVSGHVYKDFITLFWPIPLLAYIIFYLTRKRFENSYIVREIYFIDNNSIREGSRGRTFVGPFTGWWRFFSHASKQEFASVIFIAGRKGEVFIRPRFQKVKDYRIGPFTNNPADIQKMYVGTDWIVPKDLNRKILIPEARVLYLRNETSIIVHYFEKWHKGSGKESKSDAFIAAKDRKETIYMYEQGDNTTSYDSIAKLEQDAFAILTGTIVSAEPVFRQNMLHTLSELRIETAYKGKFSPGEVILIGEHGGQVTFEEYAKATNLEAGEFDELSNIAGNANIVVGTDGYYPTAAGQNVLLFIQDSKWGVPGIDKAIYTCVGGYEGAFYQQSDKATYVKPQPDTSGVHLPLKKLCMNGGRMSVTRREISKLIK